MLFPPITLVVTLFDEPYCRGHKRVFVHDAILDEYAFHRKAESALVQPGPDYDYYKRDQGEPFVNLVAGSDAFLTLTVGKHDLLQSQYNFGHVVSSMRFNAYYHTFQPVDSFGSLPLMVELYEHENFRGRHLVFLGDSANIPREYGDEFNDLFTSVRVDEGPTFAPGNEVQLFRDINFQGGGIDLSPGEYPNIGNSHSFNDLISSIRFR